MVWDRSLPLTHLVFPKVSPSSLSREKSNSSMLFLGSIQQPEWKVEANSVLFKSNEAAHKEQVPTLKLISRSIQYAKELERIV